MKVCIIEDEPHAAERLKAQLAEVDPSIEVLAILGSIQESVSWLSAHQVDLIFLDIQLSDGLSFTIFERVQVEVPIIFTTAYDQYAIKAFQHNSIAYLLKPIRTRDLKESLDKLKSLKMALQIDFEHIQHLLEGKSSFKKRFLVQVGQQFRKVDVADIAYIYAREGGVFLRSFDKKTYTVEYALESLEDLLDPSEFFRINRKYIVNINAIDQMTAWSRSRVKLLLKPDHPDSMETVVSIERSADFKHWLNQ